MNHFINVQFGASSLLSVEDNDPSSSVWFLEGMREQKTILNLIQEVLMIRNLFLLVLSQNKVKNKFYFSKENGGCQ